MGMFSLPMSGLRQIETDPLPTFRKCVDKWSQQQYIRASESDDCHSIQHPRRIRYLIAIEKRHT